MQPTWLIEASVEGLPSEQLQAEIRRQGMSAHVVKPFLDAAIPRDLLGAEKVPKDACVVFVGTLDSMRHIRLTRRWVPGGWCSFENLACSTYYAYFGEHLLNRNYTLLPIVEAIRQVRRLYSMHGADGKAFVRPDSVDKTFTGKVVDINSLEQFLSPHTFDPTMLVLIAEPREISREWRLFVAQSEVVTGCQYREQGVVKVASGVPAEVKDFAENVLRQVRWRPDTLFVLDVCESEENLYIVELNSFSCSGPIACDLEAYVRVASRHAAVLS